MGSNHSKAHARTNSVRSVASIGTKEARRIIPDLQFRVLLIGKANAGKTSILQRVCETTESPKIYRRGMEVRRGGPNFYREV